MTFPRSDRAADADQPNDSAPDPLRSHRSPELLAADPALTNDQKIDLLRDWLLELDNRLNAESEGMGLSDPMRAQHEAQLADETARVKAILANLEAHTDTNP